MAKEPNLRLCFIAPGQKTMEVLLGDTSASGGAESQMAYIATAFVGLGHHVELIYGNGRPRPTSTVVAGIKCIDAFPNWKNPRSLFNFWTELKKSKAEMLKSKFMRQMLS